MTIRNMTLADYDAVDNLMQLVHKIHTDARPDLFLPLKHPYSFEEYQKMIASEEIICILAEEDGKTAGICFVSLRQKTCMVERCTAYLEDLCVAASFQHQGVGKALYQEAERLARKKGAIRMDLMVWSFNQSAIRFYESLGLRPQRYIFEKNL